MQEYLLVIDPHQDFNIICLGLCRAFPQLNWDPYPELKIIFFTSEEPDLIAIISSQPGVENVVEVKSI